jgi:pyruvate dehydrogenase E2 component (dihydrolipoamide acetyltransferase)
MFIGSIPTPSSMLPPNLFSRPDMSIELKMPALSPTMEKGTLAKWLVAVGDMVKPGDLLAEIETDKATMEFEAVDGGRITRLLIAEGSGDVAVGTPLALLSSGEDQSVDSSAAIGAAGGKAGAGIVAPVAAKHPPEPAAEPVPQTVFATRGVEVSALAQRIATVKGLDLAGKAGSGRDGRILLADLGLAPSPKPHVTPMIDGPSISQGGTSAPPAGVPVETVPLSSMRRTIARRLGESKRSVPHFYLVARCRLDALLALRVELNEALTAPGIKLSVNDMLIKALALALLDVPDANVQFDGEDLHRFGRADISMAVALDNGLITPVIRDAGALSLSAISAISKDLVDKARVGRMRPDEYEGGTASISNLGMFGIDEIIPVINPPQAMILGVGAGIEQPWKVEGQVGLATIMAATASFDHRAIDGATGARLMQSFRDVIEQPYRLLC